MSHKKADSTDRVCGFAPGELVEATKYIMFGCPKGTRLKVIGPNTDKRYPIGVVKQSDPAWMIGVTKHEIRRIKNTAKDKRKP